jgi:pimeloyl-ACP methyl ester carboxylesterase
MAPEERLASLETADGTRIFYEVGGKGAPPFLFIHGWCSNLGHWDSQLRFLGKRHRVLAIDRRGHGRSGVPAEGYTAQQHASDIAEVAVREEIRSAIVVGHAGGAPATLELARSFPELVRAVVLVDAIVGPSARIGDPADVSGRALGAIIDRLEGERGAAELREMYAGFFSEHAGEAGDRALAEALATPLPVAVAELRSLAIDTQAIARKLEQPVLWLTAAGADEATLRGGSAGSGERDARAVRRHAVTLRAALLFQGCSSDPGGG